MYSLYHNTQKVHKQGNTLLRFNKRDLLAALSLAAKYTMIVYFRFGYIDQPIRVRRTNGVCQTGSFDYLPAVTYVQSLCTLEK